MADREQGRRLGAVEFVGSDIEGRHPRAIDAKYYSQIRFDHGAVDRVARLCRERMNFMRLQRRMKGDRF